MATTYNTANLTVGTTTVSGNTKCSQNMIESIPYEIDMIKSFKTKVKPRKDNWYISRNASR